MPQYWRDTPIENLQIKLIHPNAKMPQYKSSGASGFDLQARPDVPVMLRAKEWKSIPTGIAIHLPPGFEGQIRPRSGLARDFGVTVLNAPGTVDEDYVGEICVVLINHSECDFLVDPGDRVAQLVIAPVMRPSFFVVDALPQTERGDQGFGSSGRR